VKVLAVLLSIALVCCGGDARPAKQSRRAVALQPAPHAPVITGGVYPSPYQHPLYRFPLKHRRDEPVRDPATPPIARSTPPPAYPPSALRARISGVVLIDIVIDRNGRVSGYRVLKPLPFGLSEAAIDAVSRWRYTPGRDANGNPVVSVIRVTVPFKPPTP